MSYKDLNASLKQIVDGFGYEISPEKMSLCTSDLEYYKTHRDEFQEHYGLKITTDVPQRGGLHIYIKAGRKCLGLTLEKDPVCCGVGYIWGFKEGGFDGAELKALMDCIMQYVTIHRISGGGKNQRFLINMIEAGRGSDWPAGTKIEPAKDPQMLYNGLYEYFKKTCVSINEMLWPNENSHNIIHHMELVFPKL